MTRRYANLMTEDLQAVHEQVSLLSTRCWWNTGHEGQKRRKWNRAWQHRPSGL